MKVSMVRVQRDRINEAGGDAMYQARWNATMNPCDALRCE